MKKWVIWVIAAAVLSGCSAQPAYETIGNAWAVSEPAAVQGTMNFALPDGAQMQTMGDDTGAASYCVGQWEIWTQCYPGGDIRFTLEQVSGMSAEAMTIVSSQVHSMPCAQVAWTTNTQDGAQVVRTAVFDDGNYHYCISVSVPEADAGEAGEFFSQILSSVTITDTAA